MKMALVAIGEIKGAIEEISRGILALESRLAIPEGIRLTAGEMEVDSEETMVATGTNTMIEAIRLSGLREDHLRTRTMIETEEVVVDMAEESLLGETETIRTMVTGTTMVMSITKMTETSTTLPSEVATTRVTDLMQDPEPLPLLRDRMRL